MVNVNEKMDTMFQCFHLPDLTFQYGFGTQGQGPGDFFLPSISVQINLFSDYYDF